MDSAKERPAMDFTIVTLGALLALAVVALAIVVTRSRGERERLAAQAREIDDARARVESARSEATQRLADKIAAEARVGELQRQLAALTADRHDAVVARDAALAAEGSAAREGAVMRQRLRRFPPPHGERPHTPPAARAATA